MIELVFLRLDMREQAIPIDDSLDYNYADFH